MVRFFGAVVIFVGSAVGVCLVGAPASWASGNCGPGYYENADGQCIPVPTSTGSNSSSPPPGATALCADGTWSFSQHVKGTCSQGHGGVQQWLVQPSS